MTTVVEGFAVFQIDGGVTQGNLKATVCSILLLVYPYYPAQV